MRNLTQWSSDDRYEWLSAYIDDELVPHDRQRVEEWLATDPDYQLCYRRLIQMQQGFQGLRAQELSNLKPTPTQEILDPSPPFQSSLQCLHQEFLRPGWGRKRLFLMIASLSGLGLGLTLLWTGLRSPWAEPVAHVKSSPTESVASVPSPLVPPAHPSKLLSSPSTTDTPPQSSTLLMSTEDPKRESGLNFALDQPLLTFPLDETHETQQPPLQRDVEF